MFSPLSDGSLMAFYRRSQTALRMFLITLVLVGPGGAVLAAGRSHNRVVDMVAVGHAGGVAGVKRCGDTVGHGGGLVHGILQKCAHDQAVQLFHLRGTGRQFLIVFHSDRSGAGRQLAVDKIRLCQQQANLFELVGWQDPGNGK